MSEAEEALQMLQQPVLRPRNPDETLQVAVTRLRKRGLDTRERERRILKGKGLIRDARKKKVVDDIVTPEKLLARSIRVSRDAKRARSMRLKVARGAKLVLPTFGGSASAKSLLVVRNSKRDPCRVTREALRSLGLKGAYSAVFVPRTPEVVRELEFIRDFVFYGHINRYHCNELFSKHLRLKKQADTAEPLPVEKTPDEDRRGHKSSVNDAMSLLVKDNITIESHLGHLGMICIEDVREEIYKCGPQFNEVSAALSHFDLSSLLSGTEVDGKVYVGKQRMDILLRRRSVAQRDPHKLL